MHLLHGIYRFNGADYKLAPSNRVSEACNLHALQPDQALLVVAIGAATDYTRYIVAPTRESRSVYVGTRPGISEILISDSQSQQLRRNASAEVVVGEFWQCGDDSMSGRIDSLSLLRRISPLESTFGTPSPWSR